MVQKKPPGNEDGPDSRGHHTAATRATNTSTIPAATKQSVDRPKLSRAGRVRALVAYGEYHPPAGRRHLGVVIVRHCPKCQHLHLHRAQLVTTADGATRTGSCGAEYVLRVLPAARRRAAA